MNAVKKEDDATDAPEVPLIALSPPSSSEVSLSTTTTNKTSGCDKQLAAEDFHQRLVLVKLDGKLWPAMKFDSVGELQSAVKKDVIVNSAEMANLQAKIFKWGQSGTFGIAYLFGRRNMKHSLITITAEDMTADFFSGIDDIKSKDEYKLDTHFQEACSIVRERIDAIDSSDDDEMPIIDLLDSDQDLSDEDVGDAEEGISKNQAAELGHKERSLKEHVEASNTVGGSTATSKFGDVENANQQVNNLSGSAAVSARVYSGQLRTVEASSQEKACEDKKAEEESGKKGPMEPAPILSSQPQRRAHINMIAGDGNRKSNRVEGSENEQGSLKPKAKVNKVDDIRNSEQDPQKFTNTLHLVAKKPNESRKSKKKKHGVWGVVAKKRRICGVDGCSKLATNYAGHCREHNYGNAGKSDDEMSSKESESTEKNNGSTCGHEDIAQLARDYMGRPARKRWGNPHVCTGIESCYLCKCHLGK